MLCLSSYGRFMICQDSIDIDAIDIIRRMYKSSVEDFNITVSPFRSKVDSGTDEGICVGLGLDLRTRLGEYLFVVDRTKYARNTSGVFCKTEISTFDLHITSSYRTAYYLARRDLVYPTYSIIFMYKYDVARRGWVLHDIESMWGPLHSPWKKLKLNKLIKRARASSGKIAL